MKFKWRKGNRIALLKNSESISSVQNRKMSHFHRCSSAGWLLTMGVPSQSCCWAGALRGHWVASTSFLVLHIQWNQAGVFLFPEMQHNSLKWACSHENFLANNENFRKGCKDNKKTEMCQVSRIPGSFNLPLHYSTLLLSVNTFHFDFKWNFSIELNT